MDDGRRGMFVHGVWLWRAYDAGPRCRYGEGEQKREWAWGVVKRDAWSHPEVVAPYTAPKAEPRLP